MNYLNCHTHKTKNPNLEIISIVPGEKVSTFHSIGVHPWKAHFVSDNQIDNLIVNQIKDSTLAIGEIGLDRMKGPGLDRQISVFKRQIEISENVKLPVIIHCVKSWETISMIKRKLQPKQTWIFHGFAKANLLKEVLHEKIIISIGKDVINNLKLQSVISFIPDNMLLLETDDADTPIEKVYEKVAQLKGISTLLLCEIIEKNFKHIFPKWQIG